MIHFIPSFISSLTQAFLAPPPKSKENSVDSSLKAPQETIFYQKECLNYNNLCLCPDEQSFAALRDLTGTLWAEPSSMPCRIIFQEIIGVSTPVGKREWM